MKKIFLFIGFLTLSFITANAQEISDNAIGLRLGDNDGFGAEISYQRKLSDNNRLEVDLGLRDNNSFDGFKATGLYQWVWQLENRFNWFAGAGGGLGHVSSKVSDASETYLFVSGVVGIEYNFDIPLMISLDYRPDIGFGDTYYDGFNSDFGLGIRYQF